MTEVADNTLVDGRYRILRPASARAGWPTSTAPRTRTWAGRSRSRCCTAASRRTRSSSSASAARPTSAAGLQHPNVVGVFDRGEHDGTYYIAMEYLAGRTLKEIVTARGAAAAGARDRPRRCRSSRPPASRTATA